MYLLTSLYLLPQKMVLVYLLAVALRFWSAGFSAFQDTSPVLGETRCWLSQDKLANEIYLLRSGNVILIIQPAWEGRCCCSWLVKRLL